MITGIDDVEVIAKIHQSCFDDGWSTRSFQEMLSNNVFFGFSSKEKSTHGFILCKKVCDEIEIITFCVLPQFRNQGIGKSLIEAIDLYAKTHSVNLIFLEVSEDNMIAQRIYEKFGYKKISERKGYYRTQTYCKNAIVMLKKTDFKK
ncbi:MAG: ribosomal protein S18-alanine N-acetyltransferase [Holosporaceae bacterium]|jgi:ribosomal-protein-alanine N-acetyltransferase|nr:ribosomal protein S18-alanine N-acetyltransferase [Holosporaceae bacterium]